MKRLFLFIVLLCASITVDAQVKFGVKGGLDFTNMSVNKDFFAKTNRTGLFFGPTMKVSIPATCFAFDLSAFYDKRESLINSTDDVESTIVQRQIIIPLNVRWQLGTDMLGVFVFAGPQVGFNMSGDKDISLNSYENVDWTWESSNFSLNLGFGFMILNQLQLSADYNIGLGKTGEFKFSELSDQLKDESGRVSSCQVGLTYYF